MHSSGHRPEKTIDHSYEPQSGSTNAKKFRQSASLRGVVSGLSRRRASGGGKQRSAGNYLGSTAIRRINSEAAADSSRSLILSGRRRKYGDVTGEEFLVQARREEGAYPQVICNRRATKPAPKRTAGNVIVFAPATT